MGGIGNYLLLFVITVTYLKYEYGCRVSLAIVQSPKPTEL